MSVYINSEEINPISYRRELDLCTGIGRIDVTVVEATVKPWDIITVYENSNKVGTFFVTSVVKGKDSFTITGQDGSKKLTDYFLTEWLVPNNQTKTAREVIIDVLDQVGLSYSFNVTGNGSVVAPGTELGLQSAYDCLLMMVQQSGWYFYFDKNNVCKIGKLKASLSNVKMKFYATNIDEFSYNYNDSSLRNKAIVWGGYDYQSKRQIFYSKRIKTAWDRHKKDIRSVVLSNGAIHTFGVAKRLANLLLTEFSRLNKEKKIQVPGTVNVTVGDVVRIELPFHKNTGIITSLIVNYASKGIETELVIDKRCPRIFAWFEWGTNPDFNDYVYVATQGSGVKRKPIGGSSWYDFSVGLQNLIIKDLRIYSGNFICVADNGYAYYRTEDTSWTKLLPGNFTDASGKEYLEGDVKAVSCAIDQVTGEYYVGYNYYEEGTDYKSFRSWVVHYSFDGAVKTKLPVNLYFTDRILIHDLDRYSVNSFIAGIGDIADFSIIGERDAYPINRPDQTIIFPYGPQMYSTSGATIRDKYEINGDYTYSGGFLEATRQNICSYWVNHWNSSQPLYDNGRIFIIGEGAGLVIYDFTPSGFTTLTGFPIQYHRGILGASGIYPNWRNPHRFLYLDKKETHPELHYITINDDRWEPNFTHHKYVFSDYSYTNFSGSELVTLEPLTYESRPEVGRVYANNGRIIREFHIMYRDRFNYQLDVMAIIHDVEEYERIPLNLLSVSVNKEMYEDIFLNYISNFIPSPDGKQVYLFVGVTEVRKGQGYNGTCQVTLNNLHIRRFIITIELKEKYSSIYELPELAVLSDNPCQKPSNCGDPRAERTTKGSVVWLPGANPVTENNKVLALGYNSDYSLVELRTEVFFQDFFYKPTGGNPCCFDFNESVPPTWCNKLAFIAERLLLTSGGVEEIATGIDTSEFDWSFPLIVPSGYLISSIVAKKATRGYNYYIMKTNPNNIASTELVQIPVFNEWDMSIPPENFSLLSSAAPYLDTFDDTIYFHILNWGRGTLYGIDYKTGILKKL
ncbi:MAG: hypothetical protein ACUVT3_02950, partial [Ignavibacterium sp.]